MRGTVVGIVALAVLGAGAMPAVAAAPAAAPASLRVGSALGAGSRLRSPDGAYTASVTSAGRLVVRHGSATAWSTRTSGANARLVLRRKGNLVLVAGRRTLWQSHTFGSGATVLRLADDGVLRLRSRGGTVWSSAIGNACLTDPHAGKRILVSLTRQFLRACDDDQQVLTTPITSGASAVGDGTPIGTWRLQSKQRDRYLHPAAGGAYFVRYWMPYDGDYGLHDSSWQHFAYGSALYRTRGSHGCVHTPRAAIAWLFGWAPIGTTVQIRR